MNTLAFGRDVAPMGREVGSHGLCLWVSTILRKAARSGLFHKGLMDSSFFNSPTRNPQLVTFFPYTLSPSPFTLFFMKNVGKLYNFNKSSFLNLLVYKALFLFNNCENLSA